MQVSACRLSGLAGFGFSRFQADAGSRFMLLVLLMQAAGLVIRLMQVFSLMFDRVRVL